MLVIERKVLHVDRTRCLHDERDDPLHVAVVSHEHATVVDRHEAFPAFVGAEENGIDREDVMVW